MTARIMRLAWAACIVGALGLAAGCGDSSELLDGGANGNGNGNADGDGGANGNGNGNADGDGGTIDDDAAAGSLACDGTTQCSNGEDDDGDGYVDLDDPSCSSCFDDDEATFATGIPGDNKSGDGTQDCFFDGNSGSGNDGCKIPDCCYDPDLTDCQMGDQTCDEAFTPDCIENCGAGTPPGCDCGGCCTVCEVCELDGNGDPVPECDETQLECKSILRSADDDPATCNQFDLSGCTTCVKNEDCAGADCENDECILCSGQDEDDLGDQCGGETSCGDGGTVCTEDTDCADGEYCALGCCINEID